MKTVIRSVFLALLICCFSVFAQDTPTQHVTAGLFYNSYSTPHATGFAAYAQKITGGTYSYSVMDITSRTATPFRLQTTTSTGIAQQIRSLGDVRVYALFAGGAGFANSAKNDGTDIGFSGTAGFLAVKPLKNGWTLNVPVRIIASTLSPPQYVVGLGIGFGK